MLSKIRKTMSILLIGLALNSCLRQGEETVPSAFEDLDRMEVYLPTEGFGLSRVYRWKHLPSDKIFLSQKSFGFDKSSYVRLDSETLGAFSSSEQTITRIGSYNAQTTNKPNNTEEKSPEDLTPKSLWPNDLELNELNMVQGQEQGQEQSSSKDPSTLRSSALSSNNSGSGDVEPADLETPPEKGLYVFSALRPQPVNTKPIYLSFKEDGEPVMSSLSQALLISNQSKTKFEFIGYFKSKPHSL